jgi:hypothetical protein
MVYRNFVFSKESLYFHSEKLLTFCFCQELQVKVHCGIFQIITLLKILTVAVITDISTTGVLVKVFFSKFSKVNITEVPLMVRYF